MGELSKGPSRRVRPEPENTNKNKQLIKLEDSQQFSSISNHFRQHAVKQIERRKVLYSSARRQTENAYVEI